MTNANIETSQQGDLLPDRRCETQSAQLASTSIAETVKALEAYPEHVGPHTRLVGVDDANAVIAAIMARSGPCVSREAHRYAGQLVAFYPAREVTDAQTYIAGLTALLAAYPEDLVRRV
jgi:hypothetical protein